jgi:FAD/FMN-containing dehydrogenase
MNTDSAAVAAAKELRGRFGPERVLMPGPSYDEAVRIWNGAVDHRPALIARPGTPAEAQAAILTARNHHLPLSVRGGGHDWAGRALRPGGLVIDLTGMRHVGVDAESRTAIVGGGATAREVVAAAEPCGLVAATGTCGAVGMAGLTLAGGYGPLNGRFGLALDNLLSADVALADGGLVTAGATDEPELFWAVRGGGGNFGVLTSLRVRLHPVHRLLAGLILFPWGQASSVWEGLGAVLPDGPEELTVQSGILSGPDGRPLLFLSPAWSGDPAVGEKAIDQLLRLGSPLVSQVAPMTYADMLGLFDAYVVDGRHYAIRTRTVPDFSPDVISSLLEAGSTRTSPYAGIYIHHFHGASARVPSDATAFGIRRPHFVVEIVAGWEPCDGDGARHRAWADSVSATLAPSALAGGYPNLLGPEDHEQITRAYGQNAARLLAAKAHFDPSGIFSATPLPPAMTRAP